MAVSYKATLGTPANLADNLCRWDGQTPGHHEVWFLMLNHRASRRGFWFRYALSIPEERISKTDSGRLRFFLSEPRVGLWAATFDPAQAEQNLGLKCEYGLERFAFETEGGFRLQVCEGRFSPSQASGRVTDDAHTIAWDMHFTPNEETHHQVAKTIKRLARPAMQVCSPNLDTRFSGVITVDGREFVLEDEPGVQSHLWGRKQVDEWVWVHANAFEKHEGTVFEGLAARQRVAGRLAPPLLSLFLRHRGEEHHFTRLRVAEQWRRNLGVGFWAFSALNSQVRIEGTAQCHLRDMLQAEYRDPDGEPLYCLNSEVANLKVRIFRRTRALRWRHVETLKSRSTARLEHACRNLDPTVKLAFEG